MGTNTKDQQPVSLLTCVLTVLTVLNHVLVAQLAQLS